LKNNGLKIFEYTNGSVSNRETALSEVMTLDSAQRSKARREFTFRSTEVDKENEEDNKCVTVSDVVKKIFGYQYKSLNTISKNSLNDSNFVNESILSAVECLANQSTEILHEFQIKDDSMQGNKACKSKNDLERLMNEVKKNDMLISKSLKKKAINGKRKH